MNKTPQHSVGQGVLYAIGAIITIALIAGIVLVGWQVGWWFTTQNTNREAHVIRNGYSNQQTLREQITKGIGDVASITVQIAEVSKDENEVRVLKAQRIASVNIVCQQADEITGDGLPADQQTWVDQNCEAGSISLTSPYNNH